MNRDTSIEKDDDKPRDNPERPKAVRGPGAKTPSTDLQPEDAGTAASGNEEEGDPRSAMKQEHKTADDDAGRR